MTNTMNWDKLGVIFHANSKHDWNYSHAQVPTSIFVGEKRIRIFYSSRSVDNISFISFIDVDIFSPDKVIYIHESPVLKSGEIGTFDEFGVMPSSLVRAKDGSLMMYYTGWSRSESVPFCNAIGLAISFDDGITFNRVGRGPIFSPNINEPFFVGTAEVQRFGDKWSCWYSVCTEWVKEFNKNLEPRYHLKYADSNDGINWNRRGIVAIDYKDEKEGGIVKASVLKREKYFMWFSYRATHNYRTDRNSSYRIGFASSVNGINWTRRDDEVGITISDSGWDSEMIAYPSVVHTKEFLYLFYNGNGFGKTGIGVAKLDINSLNNLSH